MVGGGGGKDEGSYGLTPRAINAIYANIDAAQGKATVQISSTMVELYNDELVDLFYYVSHGKTKKTTAAKPKLHVKKNAKGLVFIQNAEILQANTVRATVCATVCAGVLWEVDEGAAGVYHLVWKGTMERHDGW